MAGEITRDYFIDFARDGYAAGDEVSADVQGVGVETLRGKDQLSALAQPSAGKAVFKLNNWAGTYSPENTTSGKAVNIKQAVRIRATSGTQRALWAGIVQRHPRTHTRADRTIQVECIGNLSKAARTKLSTALFANYRTDQAIQVILDALGLSGYTLDTGKTTLTWWWLSDENAMDALKALVATEGPGAALFERADGTIEFQNRHYRELTAESNTSQGTFYDGAALPVGAEIAYHEGLVYDRRENYIVNECTIAVKRRTAKATQVVWEMGEDIDLTPNETYEVNATVDDPFQNAIAPSEAGGDFTRNSGGGFVILNLTSGQQVTIAIGAGPNGFSISDLRLRADPVTVDNTIVRKNTLDMTTSIDDYGLQTFPLATRPEIDTNVAQDFCNAVVSAYKDPRPIAYMRLLNQDATYAAHMLDLEISDRITLQNAQDLEDLDKDFHVEQIVHRVHGNGGLHETVFGCESAVDSGKVLIIGHASQGIIGTNVMGF